MSNHKLSTEFYQQKNVVNLSKQLLGKVLCTRIEGNYCAGIITETEAYEGINDRACHAYGGRRTKRTETMYQAGGCSYVYLCYGIHHLFNIVTHTAGTPHAILVRGVQMVDGIELALLRRNKQKPDINLSRGPGTCSQALGITTAYNAESLQGTHIWLEDRNITVPEKSIKIGPRIGVDYAGEDALLPYRFLWDQN